MVGPSAVVKRPLGPAGRLGSRGWAITIDPAANAAGAALVSQPSSHVEARVIATDEEAMIARHPKTAVERATAA